MKGKGKKKQKNPSNVFSMFEKSQLQEFKEAFGMIDNNRDGTICAADLKGTYASLGIMNVEDEMVAAMMKEAPAALTFTVFLGMLAEKLHGTDPEDVIVDAFKEFDENNTGFIPKADLEDCLMSQADRFTPEEMEKFFAISKVNEQGLVDYKDLAYVITHGQSEDADEEAEE